MPRRQAVYGKRSRTALPSNNFANFSPARSHKQPTHIRFDRTPSPPPQRQEKAITSLETALEQLNVADGDNDAAHNGPSKSQATTVTTNEKATEQIVGKAGAEDVGCSTPPNGVLQPRSVNSIQRPSESKTNEKSQDQKPVATAHQKQKAATPAPRSIRTRGNPSSTNLQPSKPTIALDDLISHAQPLLDLCTTANCAPATIIGFQGWANKASKRFTVTKIAEASYGEVYRLSSTSSTSKSSESVFKIIPLQPPPLPPGQKPRGKKRNTFFMSSISSVTSELSLLRRMSPIPGFTSFRGASVMRGPLPTPFTAAWKAYKQLQKQGLKKIVDGGSMFPDPTRRGSYSPDQLWAVIEMQDAGTDLETKMLEGSGEVWDVFWGVACALAKGEEGVRFEHRDLHLGNICIQTTRPTSNHTNGTEEISQGWKLGASGIETTIIDYTLSRADMNDPLPKPHDVNEINDVAFYDLEQDPALFEGDVNVDYQYEIYRLMRTEIFSAPSDELTNQDLINTGWRTHHPRTNILWLYYILSSLLNRTFSPILSTSASSSMLDNAQSPTSTSTSTSTSDDINIESRLKRRLLLLVDLLNPRQTICNAMGKDKMEFESVSAVVKYAVDKGWLDKEDVVG
ncbi:MAG: hypothetical protein M1812_001145 [Candelaria pacifica]|nr:MAG: hypothetical protein M1812_001145 [Candelaria pacifica]